MSNIHSISAAMVDAIGSPRFSEVMVGAFQSIVDYDSAVVIAFENPETRPYCLAAHCAGPEMAAANEIYFDKYFKNCEVMKRLQHKRGGGDLSMIRQHVGEIINRDYRRELYEEPGIAHDLMLLQQSGPMFFNLELFRSKGGSPFTDDEEMRIKEFWPFALSCIQKNARLAGLPKAGSGRPSDRLSGLVAFFLERGVSNREAEVCGHIVLGYSTLAISMYLNISVNTVSTLRHRAYSKLGISCLNELHALCPRTVDFSLTDDRLAPVCFEGWN